ncbi:MAG: glycoside hydrolase family 88 protein [Rikenellaceae bacterium]|nr:glycoside hydrolase family 88 protein [Rikenellaceae bacterium]
MKKILLIAALACTTALHAQQGPARSGAPRPKTTQQQAEEAVKKIAERILRNTTYTFKDTETGQVYTNLKGVPLKRTMTVESHYNNWHYTNGVTNIAMLEMADRFGDKRYEDFVLRSMNFVFNEGNLDYFRRLYDQAFAEGGWRAVPRLSWHMIFRNKRLDDNGPMGASLIELQQRHPSPAFLDYINTTAEHLNYAEPRLADGTIARIWPHENTIWADDAFMAVSFLCRMGKFTGDDKYFDDAANQILKYTQYLWCPEKQIYYHCYHTDVKEHGVAHWSRANGWIFMATADLLTYMPENHPKRQAVIDNFRMQAQGVARYQAQSGLWHQLLDKSDSYEEISGTAMFVFGMARGVKKGWLHPDYIYVAEQGTKGILSMMTEEGDVTNICVGTGIMPSLTFYYTRPTEVNAPMGEGPVIRALMEMSDAPRYTEINANDQYDKIVVKK